MLALKAAKLSAKARCLRHFYKLEVRRRPTAERWAVGAEAEAEAKAEAEAEAEATSPGSWKKKGSKICGRRSKLGCASS